MTGLRDRYAGPAGTGDDPVAAQLAATKRRRVWRIVIVSNAVALVAAIAGCLFLMGTQGIHADVSKMRDEVGENLTMMSLGGASEAVARHIPGLLGTTARWNRKFADRREAFRGLDVEIDQVQAMCRLGDMAERWRRELEGVSPMQRNEIWQKSIKAQVVEEQKKWPNITHEKGVSEWLRDVWLEFWYGIRQGLIWPCGAYDRIAELVRDGRALDSLDVGGCLRYVLFPYRLSAFTMLRLAGIALVTSGLGYLLCWLGMKSRFGWLSYLGLIYFLYLVNVAIFIVWLEVTR